MGTTSEEAAAATVAELAEFKTSMSAAMDSNKKEMTELHEMIAQLLTLNKAATPTSPEAIIPPSEQVGLPLAQKEDVVGDESLNSSTSGKEVEKGDCNAVKRTYSPDPLLAHPRINHIGDPPKLDACTSFVSCQNHMKSHINSSCIELW